MIVHCTDPRRYVCDATASVLRDEGENAASVPVDFAWDLGMTMPPAVSANDWAVVVLD